MKKINAQAIIAIIIISVFMIVSGIIAIYSYANGIRGIGSVTASHLTNYVSLFSGIIGTILGYIFGKETAKIRKP